ncbi:hypothetical protein BHM03_00057325 [Ensete ventricosum]|nr:hypothetical protein BHM03_00057325 [Ensete ventricosum]
MTKVCNTDGYCSYRVVRTGLPVDRYADCPLPGDTADWGCFYPVTTQNRPVTIDFNHRRQLSGDNSRFRPSSAVVRRYQPKEKKEEGEEEEVEEEGEERGEPGSRCCSPVSRSRSVDEASRNLPAWGEETSPRVGRRNEVT